MKQIQITCYKKTTTGISWPDRRITYSRCIVHEYRKNRAGTVYLLDMFCVLFKLLVKMNQSPDILYRNGVQANGYKINLRVYENEKKIFCLVCVKIELNVDCSNIHSINLMWASQ